ncbi:otoancorin [Hippoglossus stenolepis]|uniref:otoancorin n=1 Tax=Hippoglossus stenolepis TaxID=195615 RepID=UPI001FB008AE|nr:otoancorin [Hippoglossus stenolepis]
MASKGGTFLLLLAVACAASAKPQYKMPGKFNFKNMAQKLMMKCQKMGYQMPTMMQQSPVFNYRQLDLPVEETNEDLSSSNLSTFLDALKLATEDAGKDSLGRVTMADSDETPYKMWNCTKLQQMIRLMRNSSEASACYMQAVVAPLSWTTLTTAGENNMDPGEYDAMVWAAKPALPDMLPSRLNLPLEVKAQYMEKIMNMMRDMYDTMSDHQRASVVKWVKGQITQNYFNCTMTPASDSGGESRPSDSMERCKSSLKWLNLKAMKTFGPYISRLTLHDVDSSPKEMLCEFFKSDRFTSTLSRMSKMKPSLSKKFLERIQECYGGSGELAKHTDKLGTLACYYDAPDLPPDLSKKLLSQLDNCNNPRSRKLRKRLVQSVMSSSNAAQSVHELGSSVTLLSPKQLSELPDTDREDILKNTGPNVRWTKRQLMALLMSKQDGKKCKEVTLEELITLQSVVEGLPRCMLKRIRAREILDDPDALRNISKRMRRGQLKTMLMGLRKDVNSSELLSKLSDPLLRVLSLNVLRKTNSTFLDEVETRTWSQSQAAYLAKKMHDQNPLNYRRLRSLLQGVTCKMIGKVADKDSLDMAQAITENPQWLSKVQAICASRKLFATLEKKRPDYFRTITEEELDDTPTLLLLHLPPAKVKDLPDSVCPVFLDKMEVANMSSLPVRAPSRPALLQRALRCLSKGEDLSELTTEDVSRLGQLLCELSASQLRLMNPDVMRSSLWDMATCLYIPQRHRMDLIQLLIQTYKDPSDWSAETMEALGPLLLLDDNATSALPNKPWMKDVLYFLRSRLPYVSDALKKKLFYLTITPPSNSERRKRAADITSTETPTISLMEELEMDNVFWMPAQMDKMSIDTFVSTVETLGRVTDYNADQLNMLGKKATEAFGPVSQMTESVVMQMGCITRGFSNTDLATLPFSLDAMEDITGCGWMESQMESVWMGVAKYNNLMAQELGAAEMVMLNQFICGLNHSEIRQLDMEAFKDAVGSMGDIQCPYQVARQLKSLAVSAFGEPSSWTEAHVSDLGNIIAGLDRTELASLKESVCPFFSETSIPLIPADNFAGLSASQLEALGPDNAAMVTTEQLAALGDKQQAALKRAGTGSQEEKPNTSESGAPSLSVEGISAFMKPLLVFLIGLLFL